MQTAVELHAMRYLQGILRVVDSIYAAACAEMPWEQLLAEMCQAGRLGGCALSVVDRLERHRVVVATYGLIPAAKQVMPDSVTDNPELIDRVLRSTPGAIWQDGQIKPAARAEPPAVRAGRMQPSRSISWACVVVGRDDRQVVCLEVYDAGGRPSSCPEPGDFLHQLAPHLSRAWRLGRMSRAMLAPPGRGSCLSDPPHAEAAPAPDRASLPGAIRLRAEFGLTKAEARLALRLAEGSSLASAAQAFNVKLTTIRSQLQQVFAKTGTSRQTELVALLVSRGYGARGPLWRPGQPEPAAASVGPRS